MDSTRTRLRGAYKAHLGICGLLARSITLVLLGLVGGVGWCRGQNTYYVSPQGNDGNLGTSESAPWASLQKVNQNMGLFTAGTTIKFECGETFRGSLSAGGLAGAIGDTITFTSYEGDQGTGRPKLTGSVKITPQQWEEDPDPAYPDVWRVNMQLADASVKLSHLYRNGDLLTLARFPNADAIDPWLRTDDGTGSNTIKDAALTQPVGYWTGATAVIRSKNWQYDQRVIGTQTASDQLPLLAPIVWNLTNDWFLDWGYFLCNQKSLLDQPDEWYYEYPYLYVYAPSGVTDNMEATTNKSGFFFNNCSFVNVVGLEIEHYWKAGVENFISDHITVRDCNIHDLLNGISCDAGATDPVQVCKLNTFERAYGNAVKIVGFITNGSDADISYNTFTDIGNEPQYGEGTLQQDGIGYGAMGILCGSDNAVIRGNSLHNIGYIGITLTGTNSLVERNVV